MHLNALTACTPQRAGDDCTGPLQEMNLKADGSMYRKPVHAGSMYF